jgi:hypothetical protein
VRAWWARLRPRQRWGGALATGGAGLTVLLAFLGNQTKPPAASTQALIALLAILAQLGSAWAFSGVGKADPGLAERSVGHLVSLAARASFAKAMAEKCQENGLGAPAMRQVMGQLSVHLSYLEEGYVSAIEDWRIFHPDAVKDAIKNAEREEENDLN